MILGNAFAVIFYLITSIYLIRRSSGERLLLGYLLFLQFWSLISCFYNDCGVYNFELFQYTETSWATSRLALLYVTFNITMIAVSKWFQHHTIMLTPYTTGFAQLRPFLRAGILTVTGGFLSFVTFKFLSGGIPLLQGMHKLSYAEESGGIEQLFLTHGFLLLFLLGWVRSEKKRDIADLLFIGSCCYLIGAGHKFSQIIYLSVSYGIVPSARFMLQTDLWPLMRKKLRIALPIVMTGLLLLSFGNYLFDAEDNDFARVILMDRVFGNQGHLWWGTDQVYWSEGPFERGHWETELDASLSSLQGKQPATGEVGMGYLMLNLLGPKKAHTIFDSGYLYTMAYPAIAVMSIGFGLTLFLQVLWGILFAVLSTYLLRSVQHGDVFRSVLALLILLPMITATFSGSLMTIVTLGMILKVLLLVMIELGVRIPSLQRIAVRRFA
jgi:hypothetical protein